MADAAVSFLLGFLTDLISKEATLLAGARDQVLSLQAELQWIHSFLLDADAGNRLTTSNHRSRLWVSQIRDVSFDAEDTIESFLLHRHRRRLGRLRCLPLDLPSAHSVARQIDDINRRLRAISASRSNYGIETVAEQPNHPPRLPTPPPPTAAEEETDAVGLESDARFLQSRLLGGDSRLSAVAVVGMGGLGKTTLARMVYGRDRVKRAFPRRAWVHISQEFHGRELLFAILKSVASLSDDELAAAEMMEESELRLLLRESLSRSKYLVVVDDIWSREAWDFLKPSFPDAKNGSRVLLTSRNRDIALYADPQSAPHKLRFLGEEESWTLLCRRALFFDGAESGCPPDLEEIGRGIAARCGGLPLAIVVVGGLLSRKERSVEEWDKILKSIAWHLAEGKDRISQILALSYDDLPLYLKPCFLYLSAFPEDSEIKKKRLLRLWVAEGFVQRRGEESLEDIADDCLQELIDRSLVQVARRSSNGKVKSCRFHDLLRDLSISVSKQDRFLDFLCSVDSPSVSIARRLSLQSTIHNFISLYHFSSSIRSFLCYSQDEILRIKQLSIVFKSFKLLRVIDLDGVHVPRLPSAIGELIHLRYLGLRETHFKRIPSSICNLYSLQTLDLGNTCMVSLPTGIWRMQQLRHINVGWVKMPSNLKIGLLSNLQSLSSVSAGSWMEELGKLTALRKLAIRGDLDRYKNMLVKPIGRLKALRSLRLRGDGTLPPFGPLNSHIHLYKMLLKGRLDELPRPYDFPPNLTKITIDSSRLERDPMEILEKLPNLQVLRISWFAYLGRKMACSAAGFPGLRVLKLEHLPEAEEWRVEKGSMHMLRSLLIKNCSKLRGIPSGLQHVLMLQEVELWDMPADFVARINAQGGEDWPTIQHVSSVTVR